MSVVGFKYLFELTAKLAAFLLIVSSLSLDAAPRHHQNRQQNNLNNQQPFIPFVAAPSGQTGNQTNRPQQQQQQQQWAPNMPFSALTPVYTYLAAPFPPYGPPMQSMQMGRGFNQPMNGNNHVKKQHKSKKSRKRRNNRATINNLRDRLQRTSTIEPSRDCINCQLAQQLRSQVEEVQQKLNQVYKALEAACQQQPNQQPAQGEFSTEGTPTNSPTSPDSSTDEQAEGSEAPEPDGSGVESSPAPGAVEGSSEVVSDSLNTPSTPVDQPVTNVDHQTKPELDEHQAIDSTTSAPLNDNSPDQQAITGLPSPTDVEGSQPEQIGGVTPSPIDRETLIRRKDLPLAVLSTPSNPAAGAQEFLPEVVTEPAELSPSSGPIVKPDVVEPTAQPSRVIEPNAIPSNSETQRKVNTVLDEPTAHHEDSHANEPVAEPNVVSEAPAGAEPQTAAPESQPKKPEQLDDDEYDFPPDPREQQDIQPHPQEHQDDQPDQEVDASERHETVIDRPETTPAPHETTQEEYDDMEESHPAKPSEFPINSPPKHPGSISDLPENVRAGQVVHQEPEANKVPVEPVQPGAEQMPATEPIIEPPTPGIGPDHGPASEQSNPNSPATPAVEPTNNQEPGQGKVREELMVPSALSAPKELSLPILKSGPMEETTNPLFARQVKLEAEPETSSESVKTERKLTRSSSSISRNYQVSSSPDANALANNIPTVGISDQLQPRPSGEPTVSSNMQSAIGASSPQQSNQQQQQQQPQPAVQPVANQLVSSQPVQQLNAVRSSARVATTPIFQPSPVQQQPASSPQSQPQASAAHASYAIQAQKPTIQSLQPQMNQNFVQTPQVASVGPIAGSIPMVGTSSSSSASAFSSSAVYQSPQANPFALAGQMPTSQVQQQFIQTPQMQQMTFSSTRADGDNYHRRRRHFRQTISKAAHNFQGHVKQATEQNRFLNGVVQKTKNHGKPVVKSAYNQAGDVFGSIYNGVHQRHEQKRLQSMMAPMGTMNSQRVVPDMLGQYPSVPIPPMPVMPTMGQQTMAVPGLGQFSMGQSSGGPTLKRKRSFRSSFSSHSSRGSIG